MLDERRAESLLFRAGALLCALPLVHVVETMRPLPVEAIASGPPFVLGMAIVRGVPVPVVDVARLLLAEASPAAVGDGSSARFVALKVAGRGVALAVDGVIGVRTIEQAAFRDLPPLLRGASGDAEAGVVSSVGALDAELLLILRAGRLVPVLEAKRAS